MGLVVHLWPCGLVFLKSRAALCAGSKRSDASMWLPDGLSWLCGCGGAAGRSQCALCPPVHLNVQQNVWAACGSISKMGDGGPTLLMQCVLKVKEMKSQKRKTRG